MIDLDVFEHQLSIVYLRGSSWKGPPTVQTSATQCGEVGKHMPGGVVGLEHLGNARSAPVTDWCGSDPVEIPSFGWQSWDECEVKTNQGPKQDQRFFLSSNLGIVKHVRLGFTYSFHPEMGIKN